MVLRPSVGIWLGALIFASAVTVLVVRAGGGAHASWQKAETLDMKKGLVDEFGVLGAIGDAHFFRLSVDQPTTLQATLEIPVWADKKFHPQLVVYQPDTATIGPTLPIQQPPTTIALVYPLTTETRQFDRQVYISSVERLRVAVDMPVTGQYYLAVYNAGQQAGRWRLTVADDQVEETTSMWLWPQRWWEAQRWASESALISYGPALFILAIGGLAAWLITKKRPTHHHKKTV